MCYILCWSIFSSRLHSYFIPFPDLYAEFPCFYANLFPSPSTVPVTYVGGSPYIVYVRGHGEHARYAQTRNGGAASHKLWKIVCRCARKIILTHNLLPQSEAGSQVPVRLPVPQGNGEANSADHVVVQPCNRNCNLSINPFTPLRNEFINFFTMNRLKFASATRAYSFSSMPSTERTNR